MAVQGWFVVFNRETDQLETREWPFLNNPNLKMMRTDGHASQEEAQKQMEEVARQIERIKRRWKKSWFWHMPIPVKRDQTR